MNGWKVAAIIEGIVIILMILGALYLIKIGNEEIEKEEYCALDYCSSSYYDAYYYESYNSMCYCLRDGEVKLQGKISI